jgi:hypothetical protein
MALIIYFIKNIFSSTEVYQRFVKDILQGRERKIWSKLDKLALE